MQRELKIASVEAIETPVRFRFLHYYTEKSLDDEI